MTVYMFIEGETQGEIKGPCNQSSREHAIECTGFAFGVSLERAPKGGATDGARTYTPITLRKPIDQSTPLLFKACRDMERVKIRVETWIRRAGGDVKAVSWTSDQARLIDVDSVEKDGQIYDQLCIDVNHVAITHHETNATFAEKDIHCKSDRY